MEKDKTNVYVRHFLKEYFDLRKNKENEEITIDSICNGVEFKGTNLWVLIFAIFIASLGLNVNSTAVIIGAMLISPLMGPIMGLGLSVGINDFDLLKHSFKSYLITSVISVITSTLYFSLTPLDEVQSELLARTSPTIYDVLIALCGGLAGIIALSTKEKGNVIPGAAIATALMPPLCTAGFGLATGNWLYALGAFYLYFINSVFISLATFLGVRIMGFRRKAFVDKQREQQVRKYIIILVLVTMCPAIYLTYGIVKSTFYTAAANTFINNELNFPNTQVISRKISYEDKEIKVVLVGAEVPLSQIAAARNNLKLFNLSGSKLTVLQGMDNGTLDMSALKAQFMEDFYKNNEQRIQEQQAEILRLQQQLANYTAYRNLDKQILPELRVLFPSVQTVSMGEMIELSVDSTRSDTLTLVLMKFAHQPTSEEREKLLAWLKVRTGAQRVKLVEE